MADRYEFIHSSVFGSYYEPCELLEESGDRCKIRYVDPYSEDVHETWIDRRRLRKVEEDADV